MRRSAPVRHMRTAESPSRLRPHPPHPASTFAGALREPSCLAELSHVLSERFLFRSGPDWANSHGIAAVLDAYSKTAAISARR